MRRVLSLVAVVALAWPSPATAGSWVWPLPAPHAVVRAFDPPAQPWLPGHRGVDLRAAAGAGVRSAGAGVVAFAGRVAGLPVVSVQHADGLRTTYQPVRASVEAGDRVAAGQRIGRLVSAGSHCPPAACLHWGLRRGEDYLDPLLLVAPGPVRLLPFGDLPAPAPLAPVAGSVAIGLTAIACARRRRSPLRNSSHRWRRFRN